MGRIVGRQSLDYALAPTQEMSMSDPYGVRPGEVSAPLPEEFDAGLYFIGRIRTPWARREDCPKNARETDAVDRSG